MTTAPVRLVSVGSWALAQRLLFRPAKPDPGLHRERTVSTPLSRQTTPLLWARTGANVGDGWRIERVTARTTTGDVFRCRRGDTAILTSLKIFPPCPPDDMARFERDARRLYGLDHPNLARVFATGSYRSRPWLAVELVDAVPVDQYLVAGSGDREIRCGLAVQLLDVLGYLHQRGVHHLGLQPSDVLVTRDARVKLVGVRSARPRTDMSGSRPALPYGSVAYVPPEWADPCAPEAASWDVYSAGVLLYEVLTGARAFPTADGCEDTEDRVRAVASAANREPLDPGPEFGMPVRDLVRKMTHPDPRHRSFDAVECLRAAREAWPQFRVFFEPSSSAAPTYTDEDAPATLAPARRSSPDAHVGPRSAPPIRALTVRSLPPRTHRGPRPGRRVRRATLLRRGGGERIAWPSRALVLIGLGLFLGLGAALLSLWPT